MQAAQVRARLGAQFSNQGPSRGMVDGDRLGVPSLLAQGQHQQVVQPFPERVNFGEPQQFSDHLVTAAKAQVQIDKRFQCPQP